MHTIVRIERLFAFGERAKARELLMKWSDQRFCHMQSEAERVRFAALKVCDGDLGKLADALELGYRDDILAASSRKGLTSWWQSFTAGRMVANLSC
ncbi:MAG: hypothetical protein GXP26_14295 [Planctomycetes bacterium]|nr:hypothetical protein [Planctomycetota bacterium]